MVSPEQQISVALEHPFTLLLIGAGVSSVLIPWFTNRWQNRKKKLEIKVELVSKMSEVMANALAEALFATDRYKEEYSEAELEKVYENIKKWYVEVNIIRSKLQSYYADTDLAKAWYEYWDVVLDYYQASINYFRSEPETKKYLKSNLETIIDYFSQNVEVEFSVEDKSIKPWENLSYIYHKSQWHNVYEIILERGNEIIKDVLRRPIKVI